jgi:hypothetical protein
LSGCWLRALLRAAAVWGRGAARTRLARRSARSPGRPLSLAPPHHTTTPQHTTPHNTTHNTTQHNTTQHNTTQHNTTQHTHTTTQHNPPTPQHNTTHPLQEAILAALPQLEPSTAVTALWCHAALAAQPPAPWLAAAAARAASDASALPAAEACRLAWALARLGLRAQGAAAGSSDASAGSQEKEQGQQVVAAVEAAAAAAVGAAPVPDAAAAVWAVSELRGAPAPLPLLRRFAGRLAGRAAQLPAGQLLEVLEAFGEAGYQPEPALQVGLGCVLGGKWLWAVGSGRCTAAAGCCTTRLLAARQPLSPLHPPSLAAPPAGGAAARAGGAHACL